MTKDLCRILHDHECVGVHFFDNELDSGNLGQGNYNKKHIFFCPV